MRLRSLALVLALGAPAAGHEAHEGQATGGTDVVALPPLSGLRYEPPPPGSYELPPIQQLEAHPLLAPDGEPAVVPEVGADGAALVSFVYLSCPAACPMTHAVLQRVDRRAAEDPKLRHRLRLTTVSFDPARDTPERMGRLRDQLAPKTDWRFLTAADAAGIEPVLEDFGQDARAAEAVTRDRPISHVLKVFLVDDDLRVRNVYSADFLDPDLLLNDVHTVLGSHATP